MTIQNKFAVSYGLIVITKNNRVMLIQRKIPYCIQNFYVFLHDQGIQHDHYEQNPFYRLKDFFETIWLPNCSENDREDYFRFQNGKVFEDMYDYPHGQLATAKNARNRIQCFMNAYREFREETGFRFSFIKENIDQYPLVKINFKGCDEHKYTQFYFIVKNVKDLCRYRYFDTFTKPFLSAIKIRNWKDDRLVYKSRLLSINEAVKLLQLQQHVKIDFKHLLLKESNSFPIFCFKHEYHNWRCSTCRLNRIHPNEKNICTS